MADLFSLVFLGAILLAGLVSLILYYHWWRYSVGIISLSATYILYTFGVFAFLASMYAALNLP